jgi:ribosomal-protein-alanine N-acetyltransferase
VDDRPQDGPALTVREGAPQDAPFIVRLGVAAFAPFGEYGTIMEAFLASSDVVAFVAETAGAPVGFALVETPGGHRGVADLVAIAVDPRYRRRGAGRALLSRVIAFVEARREASLIVLTVADDNDAAIRLFRDHGFQMLPGTSGRYAGGQTSRRMARAVLPGRSPAR